MANFQRIQHALSTGDYPRSVFSGKVYDHCLRALEEQLNARADQLFSTESKTAVRLLELSSSRGEGMSTVETI
jgi:hypothetical protein